MSDKPVDETQKIKDDDVKKHQMEKDISSERQIEESSESSKINNLGSSYEINKKIILDSDTELNLSIPSNLYIDKYEVNRSLESDSISLLNFLNNNNESEKEETVDDKIDQIKDLLENHNVLLIQGNTGCGKTTRIPRLLLSKYKKIVCTQPRRIAAISVAKKVAKDMNSEIGKLVGYSVRFENVSSENTRLKFVTDGIILKEILFDRNLKKYDCVIIDEAHERSLNIDILLGYLKRLLKIRKDLKIIIMSATIATEKFVNFFNCPCVTIKHKTFPLTNYFIKSYEPTNYFEETLKTVIKLYKTEPTGDVLVFLTGQDEIKDAYFTLLEHLDNDKCEILMVFSTMPPQDQELIFKKTNKRKIILSTNICETSITIENIRYVVDCGRVKMKKYSDSLGIEILDVVNISKAQANQRSGRAGRTQPGTVFRIFTRNEYKNMIENPIPEILSCNLNDAVLILKSLGITNLKTFDMIDKPTLESVNNSLEYLFITRAINVKGEITLFGKRISNIPLDANLSISLLASIQFGCFEEVSTIVSMLSVDQIFMDITSTNFLYKKYIERRESLKNNYSDFVMLLDIYQGWEKTLFDKKYLKHNFLSTRNMWQAKRIREQLKRQFNIKNSSNRENILLAFCAGFYPNTAKLVEGSYKTIFNETNCYVHFTSCIYKKYSKYILYYSITKTKKEYLRYCNEITSEMLCSVLKRTIELEGTGKKGALKSFKKNKKI
ncbi:Putative pre-mRNA-splicing factor ATP-dependent RNA helicase DHX16 [Nosema bombycis CQ1]|uniref:Putative pre-mRNA-splicing factor ATP-dependent RNA helicase DHX16 n=1 Tax=Nosema bombycis (strain CQ1 / CVCC 102059) TaxID=578461 RepID=R0KWN7_NOSB1|nr:Putative pre-mRNA-splicing factor ATP-dependent RNA helicase DHX16 [Nosema bombycis CQ1]|eukprot:EOB14642.1 Putative pre-mRNA-splicing factor ATP-dependent RNA helicase DHX16 [Nosema bombycis CQ1]